MKRFSSGTALSQKTDYKAFQPTKINRKYSFDDPELLKLVEETHLKLGELNAFSELIPDVDQFIRLYVTKEATVSSRIEGTQTEIEEAMLSEVDIHPEKKDDWREVNNYIQATNQSIKKLNSIPLSSRLLKSAHKTLLAGVRGKHKLPGEFRKSQNWIGGSSLRDALFIPPPWQEVNNLMGDLESFLHNQDTGLPEILKIGIAHYQFETIHPFLDGNGRIGRLMIVLYLLQSGILKKPVLYLSNFFEKNRMNYYDNLMRVRLKNDLRQWLLFFTVGTLETTEQSIDGLRKIIELKHNCESNRISRLGKKVPSAKLLLHYLFNQPIIRAEEASKVTGLSLVSTYKLLEDFVNINILKEITGGSRNRMFSFQEYFKIFK